MNKKQRTWLIVIGGLEVAIILFSLVVSILVLVTSTGADQTNLAKNGPFIGYLQNTPTTFFLAFVLPLFIIFIGDGIYLIYYSTKKESALTDKERDAIQEAARQEAREEVLKELHQQKGAPKDKPKD